MAKKIKKRRIWYVLGALLLIIVVSVVFASSGSQYEYTTVPVKLGNLTQTVMETGTIDPVHELNLTFMSAGRLGENLVKIGDKVKTGDVLAKLDLSDLLIKKQEAEANLNMAKANLQKLIIGPSASEIAVSQANVNQAKSNYESAQRDLEKIKKTTQEKLTQAEKNYANLIDDSLNTQTAIEQAVVLAQTNLNNITKTYQNSVDNKKDTLLITIDNKLAVLTAGLDAINRILTDDDIDNFLSVRDAGVLYRTKDTYETAVNLLTLAKTDLNQAKTNPDLINTAYNSAVTATNKTFSALNYCFSALENSITSSTFSQTELDAFKTTINTHITNVSSALTSLQTAKQNLDDAELTLETKTAEYKDALAKAQAALSDAKIQAEQTLNTTKVNNEQSIATAQAKVDSSLKAWQVAQAQLANLTAKARSEDLALQRAKVNQAQAQLDLINSQITQNTIIAPMDGVITKVEFEVGEQTSPNQTVIAMLAENNFVLKLDISETDISKIKINNPATITIDAYGDDIKFQGKVSFIEPAETEIQGVVYYKVDIVFDPNGYEIKSGMTASADIITAHKENIILAPSRGILDKDNYKIARVLVGKKVIEKRVKTGLDGDEGLIEIKAGLRAGEQVITYIKEKK